MPKRIVLFFRKLAGPGGAERSMYEEALYFKRDGIDVQILTFSLDSRALFDPPYPVSVTQLGSIPLGSVSWVFAEVRNIFLLRRALVQFRPDIVLCSSGVDCMPMWFATLGLRIPYATHIHGTIFWFDEGFISGAWKYARIHRGVFGEIHGSVIGHKEFCPPRPPKGGWPRRAVAEILARILYLAIRKAVVLFTLSSQMAWEIKKLYDREAIVVKGGISPRLLDHVPRQDVKGKLGLDGRRLILNVNRLDPRKRVALVIRAFRRLVNDYADLQLVIGGTGREEERLKALVQSLGLDGRVLFVGYIREDELPDYLASCDVFVHPNWADFAISPYEALALQRKVVWSTEMEVDEHLRHNQHLFPADPTVPAMAEAIRRALETEVRTRDDMSPYRWDRYGATVLKALSQAVPGV